MTKIQRGTPRILANVRIHDANDEAAGPWLTRDLAANGLFVLAPDRWQTGEAVSLVLEYGQQCHRLEGRVARNTKEGVGVELEQADTELQTTLGAIMAECYAAGTDLVERRRDSRRSLEAQVLWRDERGENAAIMDEVSTRGAVLYCQGQPGAGATVQIKLPVQIGPAQPAFIMGCKARVVHVKSGGFGVEFIEPSEEFIDHILRMLSRR